MINLEQYHFSIDSIGLEETWNIILKEYYPSDFFSSERLGGLYEDGLAYENKIEKKAMGKYYTPIDVAEVMAEYLLRFPEENICDVCCGTGNLILAVLDKMGTSAAVEAIKNKHIYLYDIDPIAIKICQAIIKNKYGYPANIFIGDCLDKNVHFPPNSKVISNPPYGKLESLKNYHYNCAKKTKEQYVAFMEKILEENVAGVIITPHSFMGGSTFKILREEMVEKGGYIFSFDNVPGNIFKGKKYGIFNSNEANSTRAAITIVDPKMKGYYISPFIRFKTEERERVLNNDFLDSLLPDTIQKDSKLFYRTQKGTEEIITKWLSSKKTLKNILTAERTEYRLDVPNTCRYFTTGSYKVLDRSGKMTIYFKNEQDFVLGYAFINSSFCYYWHRMCNGGITYPISLLKEMPIFDVYSEDLKEYCLNLISEEEDFLVYKTNAGADQENIKFPESYRKKLNEFLINALEAEWFDLEVVHLNSCIEQK